jgi:hypothetical protein
LLVAAAAAAAASFLRVFFFFFSFFVRLFAVAGIQILCTLGGESVFVFVSLTKRFIISKE